MSIEQEYRYFGPVSGQARYYGVIQESGCMSPRRFGRA